MIKVYTKIEGKLALFDLDTDDYEAAILEVRRHLGAKHLATVLGLIEPKVGLLVA